MNMLRRLPVTYLAYLCLLMGFVALGLFVYALAAQSQFAVWAGAALVLFFGAALAGFRAGARSDSGNPARRAELERYRRTYRGAPVDSRVVPLRREDAPSGARAA